MTSHVAFVDNQNDMTFLRLELMDQGWGKHVGRVHVRDERLAILPADRLKNDASLADATDTFDSQIEDAEAGDELAYGLGDAVTRRRLGPASGEPVRS